MACAILATLLSIGLSSLAFAQEPSPAGLVRAAVANEVAANEHPQAAFLFRARKQTSHGSQSKLYVETKDAMAGMVIAYNDQPLTPKQLEGEKNHLAGLVNNPDLLRRKSAQEKEDADRTLRIVKAMPDAFLFEYDRSGTPGSEQPASALVRLKFRPNPAYSPPSHVEQVLSGMQGYVVIDVERHRLAEINGTLFRDVTFGWGILGHLDKGGHFLVQQADVGNGAWDITRMSLNFTGKILFFKGINIVSDEVFSDFHPVALSLTFAQGVELLETEQAKSLKSGSIEPVAKDTTAR